MRAAWRRIYERLWHLLVRWFRVPDAPPSLPVPPGETAAAFRPAPGFLAYLKFRFWVLLALFEAGLLVGWIGITVALPWLGAILLLPFLAAAVLPGIACYVALHLRCDTTWYVITSRSVRIRRGIWILHETTITFENVQNITVMQGPIERHFSIGNVVVETAGGGGRVAEAHGGRVIAGHTGLIEGVANAAEIRDLILRHVRQTRTAGLGDEGAPWSADHVALLREIRDAARSLA
jgi:membrane protein YdbS with pleckstrin-like domain